MKLKHADVDEDDMADYAQEVAVATAGLGVGLSLFFGLVTFISMIVMCCRCKRLHRADLAIAQAEGDNHGKSMSDCARTHARTWCKQNKSGKDIPSSPLTTLRCAPCD